MKKTVITIIAAVLATSLFSSCDRMLEEVNYGNPTTADLMTNESNVALLVGQCYAEVKWLHGILGRCHAHGRRRSLPYPYAR